MLIYYRINTKLKTGKREGKTQKNGKNGKRSGKT